MVFPKQHSFGRLLAFCALLLSWWTVDVAGQSQKAKQNFPLERDHIFVWVSPGAPEAVKLQELGFYTDGKTHQHVGQGTASKVFLFENAGSSQRPPRFKIVALKAMLFYEDKGTFSEDVTDDDSGTYYPPRLWNTPIHYENRSSSVFVTVEVAGEPAAHPERKLELVARYAPLGKAARAIVVRKIVSISILNEKDSFHAGFWLYDTGCDPVRLTARIIGPRETSTVKRVIKFDCGE